MKKLLLVLLLSTGLYASQEENSDAQQELNFLDLSLFNADDFDLNSTNKTTENSTTLEYNSDAQEKLNSLDLSLFSADDFDFNFTNKTIENRTTLEKAKKHSIDDDDDINPKRFHYEMLMSDLRPINSTERNLLTLQSNDYDLSKNNDNHDETYLSSDLEAEIIRFLENHETFPQFSDDTNSAIKITEASQPPITTHTSTQQDSSLNLQPTLNLIGKNTAKKKYQCTKCDYFSILSSDFKKHMQTHTSEKPFKCTYEGCNYDTNRSDHLITHMQIHTGEKHNICRYCDKAFIQKNNLYRHIKTQHKDLPSNEPEEYGYSEHISKNTSKKKYQCTKCDYFSIISSDFKKHMRIHTGEKPFKCTYEECNHSTSDQSNLTRHIQTHIRIREKPYQCTQCNYSTAYKSDLKRHLRRRHPEESDDSEHEEDPS